MKPVRSGIIAQVNKPITGVRELGSLADARVILLHREGEPAGVNRLHVTTGNMRVELLPSRGLSLGSATVGSREVFWDPPTGLADPDTQEPSRNSVWINGGPAPGYGYIESFTGGIELLGLDNWGMPRPDLQDGSLLPLHGTVHAMPLSRVEIESTGNAVQVKGRFLVRSHKGRSDVVWHKRGAVRFEVTRIVVIDSNPSRIVIVDSFRNASAKNLLPDWGYHVTFRPEPGATLLVPSAAAEVRGGGPLPVDFREWIPSPDPIKRIEQGVIMKDLQYSGPEKRCTSTLRYPDGRKIYIHTPPVPYFQTWFCSGGAGSTEFTRPDGKPLLLKNWDGMGIEFGSSALDHDHNTDPLVPPELRLAPGEVRAVKFEIECDF